MEKQKLPTANRHRICGPVHVLGRLMFKRRRSHHCIGTRRDGGTTPAKKCPQLTLRAAFNSEFCVLTSFRPSSYPIPALSDSNTFPMSVQNARRFFCYAAKNSGRNKVHIVDPRTDLLDTQKIRQLFEDSRDEPRTEDSKRNLAPEA